MNMPPHPDDSDDDTLLASLENETENDPALAGLRAARVQALAADLKRSKQLRSEGYGSSDRFTDEKKLMELTAGVKHSVVHFFKSDFARCRVMDGHLEALAPHHLSTRFLRIDVEHAPFLVTKLGIKVLPCVIAFVDGVSVDRIVGFEGLGYSESTFTTGDLEKRLVGCGVLENERGLGDVKARRGREERGEEVEEDGGDDDEWD